MLVQDRRLTLKLIAEELGISKDTARTIVRDDLGKRKICSQFVPHKLTETSRKQNGWKLLETSFPCLTRIHCFWKTSSREMRSGATSSILNQNGNRWRGVHRLPRDQKKSRLQKYKVKTPFIAFFNNIGIIHKEFGPAGQTIIAAFCQVVFNRLFYSVTGGFDQSCTGLEMDAAPR